MLRQCTRHGPAWTLASWAPTKNQVEEADARLVPLLKRVIPTLQVNGAPVRGVDPRAYYRQYVGVMRGTRRILYINAFIPETAERVREDMHWRTEPRTVCDGGSAFFGAQYDPGKHQFVALDFNDAVNGPVRY